MNSSVFAKSRSKQIVPFFSSFRARSIRTVLSHVPSPAPASLSHISALQFVSVLPLERGEMSPLRFVWHLKSVQLSLSRCFLVSSSRMVLFSAPTASRGEASDGASFALIPSLLCREHEWDQLKKQQQRVLLATKNYLHVFSSATKSEYLKSAATMFCYEI